MKTLLIGANGQVGYELATRLAGSSLIATTRSGDAPFEGIECMALDVGDPAAIRGLILSSRPALVINASAYTAVDRAETEQALAFRINAAAPATMAAACMSTGARLVHYSTDYVFDGAGNHPYRTTDATQPLGIYGLSKCEGEQAVLASGANALVLRTAWVYAMRGSNFLQTMLRLAGERDELRVVDDQIGTPTPAWLIAQRTLELLDHPAARGIHHVVTSGQTSWHGFATAIFDAAVHHGLIRRAPRVIAIESAAYPTPARRPAYSVLDTSSLREFGIHLPGWREALDRTIDRTTGAARAALG